MSDNPEARKEVIRLAADFIAEFVDRDGRVNVTKLRKAYEYRGAEIERLSAEVTRLKDVGYLLGSMANMHPDDVSEMIDGVRRDRPVTPSGRQEQNDG